MPGADSLVFSFPHPAGFWCRFGDQIPVLKPFFEQNFLQGFVEIWSLPHFQRWLWLLPVPPVPARDVFGAQHGFHPCRENFGAVGWQSQLPGHCWAAPGLSILFCQNELKTHSSLYFIFFFPWVKISLSCPRAPRFSLIPDTQQDGKVPSLWKNRICSLWISWGSWFLEAAALGVCFSTGFSTPRHGSDSAEQCQDFP